VIFYICRCCYRGHRYCPVGNCRAQAQKFNRHKKQKKYVNTSHGRQVKKENQNRYLERKTRSLAPKLSDFCPTTNQPSYHPRKQSSTGLNQEKKIDHSSLEGRDSIEVITEFSILPKTENIEGYLAKETITGKTKAGGKICVKCGRLFRLFMQKGDDG
jgi:hypothetical protein